MREIRDRLARAEAAIDARPSVTVLDGLLSQRDRQIEALAAEVQRLRSEVERLHGCAEAPPA